jgi:hypothetical protein
MRTVSRKNLVWIARIGFVGRGVVFLILGGVALWAALSDRTLPVGTAGAMNAVVSQPAGGLLGLAIAIGLLCFAALRMIEAIDDVYDYGDDWHGWMQRGALAAAGLFYTALGILGASIVLTGQYAKPDDAQVRDWTAWALEMPWGTWLVALAGGIVAAIGIGLAVAGFRKKFASRLRKEEGSRIVIALGVVGFLARSVVFVLMGCFLLFAAWHADPDEALGFSGALRLLRGEPYGQAMLLAAAAGLIAFGTFGVAEARYGRAARPRRARSP